MVRGSRGSHSRTLGPHSDSSWGASCHSRAFEACCANVRQTAGMRAACMQMDRPALEMWLRCHSR
eukprot:9631923-Alexandrium_andersonii.AAC.1